MKIRFISFVLFFLTLFSGVCVMAQSSNPDFDVFDKDGLSFSFPADWKVTDQSTTQMQQVKLTLKNSSALIYINSPRSLVTTEQQFYEARQSITDRYAENIRTIFADKNNKAEGREENVCVKVDSQAKLNSIFHGLYQDAPGTAEIFTAIIEHRFVNLVFIRNDSNNAETNPAWQRIVASLKIAASNAENLPPLTVYNPISGGVLNGKAIKLPRPFYPNGLRLRGVRTVAVKVVLDEEGKVIEARAQSGDVEQTFLPIAEQAAKEARFNPSYMCGKPVRVTGIILYKFDNRR